MSSKSGNNNEDLPALTAAELIRRRRKLQKEKDTVQTEENPVTKEEDLDEAIKRLEAKLNDNDEDEDDTTSRSTAANEDDDDQDDDNSAAKIKECGILNFSSLKDERIESLPEEYLPKTTKRILKGIDTADESTKKEKHKKKKRKTDKNEDLDVKMAVQKILGNYQPRSAERLPFYCRCCAKQCKSESDFFAHKQTDFHKTAVEMERKASYCKMCRKQLTSPAQLNEHIQSKPHKERLEMLKSKQRTDERRRTEEKRTKW